jgi:hypothetical protein
MARVKTLIVFKNGMVASCDENGQIPELQGHASEVIMDALAECDQSTELRGSVELRDVIKCMESMRRKLG